MESPEINYIWVAVLSDNLGSDWRHSCAASRSSADLSDFSGANLRVIKVKYSKVCEKIHVIARFFDDKTQAVLTYPNHHIAETEFKNALQRHSGFVTKDHPERIQDIRRLEDNTIYSTIYNKHHEFNEFNKTGGRWIYFPDVLIID